MKPPTNQEEYDALVQFFSDNDSYRLGQRYIARKVRRAIYLATRIGVSPPRWMVSLAEELKDLR